MQSVYVRILLYVLSSMLALVPLGVAQYGVSIDAEAMRITVDLQVLVPAVFAGFAMSAGILKRWGVR